MSIALLITDAHSQNELIPIATEDIFDECWLPLCRKQHCQWIPLFKDGLPLEKEIIPLILNELATLEQHLSDDYKEEQQYCKEMIYTRLIRITSELRLLLNDPQREGYIG